MNAPASIHLFYSSQESQRFDGAAFDAEDIKALLLDRENLCVGGHRTRLSNVVEDCEQDIYEFCVALMRNEKPCVELLREKLNEQLNKNSNDFVTEIEP